MADDNNSDADTNHHQDGGVGADGAGADGAGADDLGAAEQDVDSFNNNIPVFLDRTFRMIENVPDDVVCWSEAGDSFIIKQVCKSVRKRRGGREEALQSLVANSQRRKLNIYCYLLTM